MISCSPASLVVSANRRSRVIVAVTDTSETLMHHAFLEHHRLQVAQVNSSLGEHCVEFREQRFIFGRIGRMVTLVLFFAVHVPTYWMGYGRTASLGNCSSVVSLSKSTTRASRASSFSGDAIRGLISNSLSSVVRSPAVRSGQAGAQGRQDPQEPGRARLSRRYRFWFVPSCAAPGSW